MHGVFPARERGRHRIMVVKLPHDDDREAFRFIADPEITKGVDTDLSIWLEHQIQFARRFHPRQLVVMTRGVAPRITEFKLSTIATSLIRGVKVIDGEFRLGHEPTLTLKVPVRRSVRWYR